MTVYIICFVFQVKEERAKFVNLQHEEEEKLQIRVYVDCFVFQVKEERSKFVFQRWSEQCNWLLQMGYPDQLTYCNKLSTGSLTISDVSDLLVTSDLKGHNAKPNLKSPQQYY